MKKVVQDLTSGGLLGVWGKWMKHAKYIYNIQDFNPEQVLAVGYTKSKLITDAMMWFDKFSCKRSDLVITVGRDLVETVENRFKDKKVPKTVMINNWIDENEIYPLDESNEKVLAFKKKYGLGGKFVIMYSGHNLSCLLACLLSIIAICFIMSSPFLSCVEISMGKRSFQSVCYLVRQTAKNCLPCGELPKCLSGIISAALRSLAAPRVARLPRIDGCIHAIAAAGRDDILGLELDDFHLSLCILFHVYTPPFAENLYVKQLLCCVTQRVSSPSEVLPH